MLEGIHWTESEVICLAKDKNLETRYKTLTEDLVREAFPNILPPAKPKTIVDIITVPKKESKAKKSAVSLKASATASSTLSARIMGHCLWGR